MPRFNPTRFPPGFFDLPASAGRELPLDVIAAWTRGDQSLETARRLLAPVIRRGIAVSSDTAGLTRMSQERPLIEIMAMVNRPKELVHAFGRATGGVPIGVWAADNTLMLYPDDGAPPLRVVSMLLTMLDRVHQECEVGIGLCAHLGVFYHLGNGLYGPDADRVEMIAEDYTEAGELILTEELTGALGAGSGLTLAPRADLRAAFGPAYRVTGGPRVTDIEPRDYRYPLPFTDAFYDGLSRFQRTRRTSLVPRPAFQDVAVVVIEHEREDPQIPEVAALNDLALAAAVRRVGQALLEDLAGQEIKTAGVVSIYLFDEARHAVDFARKLREVLAQQEVQLRMGIAVGRVLVFELGPGLRDVAGAPVNVASKLAQDLGEFGIIQATTEAARAAGLGAGPPRHFQIGGVSLEAVRV
jgi:hypothetical protein